MSKNKQDYNEYMRKYMLARYKKRREAALVALGGCCVECGSTEFLDIHHVDPPQKAFTLAKGSSVSEKRWQEELLKCQLLCRNCHIQEHSSDAECGTVHRYWTGCRCELCKQAMSLYNKEYNQNKGL